MRKELYLASSRRSVSWELSSAKNGEQKNRGESLLPYFSLADFRTLHQLIECLELSLKYITIQTSDTNLYLLLQASFFNESHQILLNPV